MSELYLVIGAVLLALAIYLAVVNRRLTSRLRRAEKLFELSAGLHSSLRKPDLLHAAEAAARELAGLREAAVSIAYGESAMEDTADARRNAAVTLPIEAEGRVLGELRLSEIQSGLGREEAGQLAKFAEPLALAMSNASVYEALEESVRELQSATFLKERLESELQIAGSIQLSFLPTTMPSANEPFDVCALLKSAKEVGGDFYNFYKIDDRHLFFTLGDVSDKGIPAALFMAMTLSLIKGSMRSGLTPGELLEKVNDMLCADDAQLFATIVCGILQIETGEVVLSDGGHCTPYLVKADGTVEPVKLAKGIPLGSFPEFAYKNQSLLLEKGDKLVVYTDGITEAENGAQEQYSASRLQQFLSLAKDYSSAEIIDALLMDVFMFAGGAPQSDDIAVLCLSRR
ncbi:PP2C family protein-serine/threonine phosphatase [Paenibacillus sp. LHD-117]|uniref:PP2C family protein-serine/threonine phosphatase n=1 Tax=Paenibacillus sp. LHD-117 TaxID=3071412 RepID=UPI0027DF5022|nr:PP2C family protein-serine/threonine phosphatase [Paenibacillus sp. LHD-117]MDQ6423043.1 PP2C family protein-serine/threonine phosphatase [Paenibacillus sp. LHD-117]